MTWQGFQRPQREVQAGRGAHTSMRVHVCVVLWACWAKVALMDSNKNNWGVSKLQGESYLKQTQGPGKQGRVSITGDIRKVI